MEHPCHKCGQIVEEGRPFCPHCGAPQIRVIMAEPFPAGPSAIAAAAPTFSESLPASETVPVLAVPMTWSQALKPCALAALVPSILMFSGLNPFVAMFGAGFLAIVFYRQARPGVELKAASGARLGVLSGLLWFAITSIFAAAIVIFLHKGPEIRQQLLTVINQAASRTSDPQMLSVFERFRSSEGLEFLMIFGLITGFIAALVLGAAGGALGGSIFGRKNRP